MKVCYIRKTTIITGPGYRGEMKVSIYLDVIQHFKCVCECMQSVSEATEALENNIHCGDRHLQKGRHQLSLYPTQW